ncbi:hypothetical protein OG352_19590 [Streptomyces sp. NBC_01485]|uniref:hypothetical protein n=1 Tax=Streptomyces sp. NBC_01485 TaxID=2903884 RepID=UPI002E330EB7|nr:hypothetical protein [Streptomyces sp. NBC_01485]
MTPRITRVPGTEENRAGVRPGTPLTATLATTPASGLTATPTVTLGTTPTANGG